MILPGAPDPEETRTAGVRQHSTRPYHRVLAGLSLAQPGHVLGITGRDLYAPHLSFSFGEADPERRVAVVSLFRLRHADPAVQAARLLIEAVHELGHTHDIPHCTSPACVMYFSSRIEESDRKGPNFCARCRELLRRRAGG